jgi:hypothetical protein
MSGGPPKKRLKENILSFFSSSKKVAGNEGIVQTWLTL